MLSQMKITKSLTFRRRLTASNTDAIMVDTIISQLSTKNKPHKGIRISSYIYILF